MPARPLPIQLSARIASKLTLTAFARATYKTPTACLPERMRRPIFVCLRQLTGKAGSFAITCRSRAERMAYCWEARFLPRCPLTDWLFWKESVLCRRPLCWNVVRQRSLRSRARFPAFSPVRSVSRNRRIGACCRVAPSSSKKPRTAARSIAVAMMMLLVARYKTSAACWPMVSAAAAARATESHAVNAISPSVFASANTPRTAAASAARAATRPARP